MLPAIIKRALINLSTMLFIVVMSFAIMKIAPGNPFEGERALSPEALRALEQKYAFTLDEYLAGIILRGDFRYSYQHRDMKVTDILKHALPISMELGLWALLVSLITGLIFGIISSQLRGTWPEHIILLIAMSGITIPNFVIGPLLQWSFALNWQLVPVAGWHNASSKILPVLTLSLMYIAYITRISRNSMLETINKDFIRTAKAKGLSTFQIIFKHIFRNSLIPVINFLGPATAALLTGTLVVEKIFNIPGMGRFFVESALQRDYPVALGVLIIFSAMLLLLNLAADIIQTLIDPRIKLN
jgi:oligopeptide transport system permease protein